MAGELERWERTQHKIPTNVRQTELIQEEPNTGSRFRTLAKENSKEGYNGEEMNPEIQKDQDTRMQDTTERVEVTEGGSGWQEGELSIRGGSTKTKP